MIASPLAAQREAQARCRRDGGPLNTVDAPSLGDWSFTGSPYDALNVAKDIVWNGLADDVRLTTDEGRVMTRDEIAAARY